MKPKDALERNVHVGWLAIWALWALWALGDLFRVINAGLPLLGNWSVPILACPLLLTYLITLCLLGIRRWYLGKDD